jgi:hypothetical protein
MPPKPQDTNRRTKHGIFAESVAKFPQRLVIMSEGDSWFSYPLVRNLADHIEMMSDFSMLRLEMNGDEAREILAPDSSQYRKVRWFLKRYPFELLMFSGGGNDLVGKHTKLWLNRNVPAGSPWDAYLNVATLEKRLDEVIAAYALLVNARDELRKDCHIVTHTYDYAVPDGRPAKAVLGLVSVGPWIQPHLNAVGLTDPAGQQLFVNALIDRYAVRISTFAQTVERFHVVDTRGTLPKDRTHWNDEIHPTGTGYGKLAEEWRTVLKRLFPNRGF